MEGNCRCRIPFGKYFCPSNRKLFFLSLWLAAFGPASGFEKAVTCKEAAGAGFVLGRVFPHPVESLFFKGRLSFLKSLVAAKKLPVQDLFREGFWPRLAGNCFFRTFLPHGLSADIRQGLRKMV